MVATGVLAAAVHRRKLLKAQRGELVRRAAGEAMVGTDAGFRLVVPIAIGGAYGKCSHHCVCVDDSRAALRAAREEGLWCCGVGDAGSCTAEPREALQLRA